MASAIASSQEPTNTTKVMRIPARIIAVNSGLQDRREVESLHAAASFGLAPAWSARIVCSPPGTCSVGMISMWPDVHRDRGGDGEGDRIGDVGGLRQQEALDEALARLGAVAVHVGEDVGRDPARTDLGHADQLAVEVDPQLARQHVHRRLGGVIGAVAAEIIGRGDGADVDHMPAIARRHAGHDQPA